MATPSSPQKLTVLISGASGMIGTELRSQLEADGHTVLRLVRDTPRDDKELGWSPEEHVIDLTVMDRVDAVVNLSGASLSHLPWTRAYRRKILDSRVQATQTLTDAMRMASTPPATFLSGSAVGYYGDQPGKILTEKSPAGSGFLSRVVRSWESAARLAPDGTRVVTFRTGVVIGPGGAMRPLLPLARLGLVGPIGGGKQNWPWISLFDEAAAITHLLTSGLSGPVNLAGPTPATSAEILRALAARLHRPYGLPLPKPVVELAMQEAGTELLLASQNVSPKLLIDDGFRFRHATAAQAIDALVTR
jgi:uncharacterized protein (TIGR01777 family)